MQTPQEADAVFEGGGVKGVGLIGALAAFEEAGFQWQNLAGTSAGAITAALRAVGYTASELRQVMDTEVDFPKLMDPSGVGRVPAIGPWVSLLFTKGMYRGDYFLQLIRRLLERKLGKRPVTFGDLVLPKEPGDSDEDYEKKYKYKLRLVASDITANRLLVLPQDVAELGLNPDDLEVAMAVRMSMSIPFFFRPARLNNVQHPPAAEGTQGRRRHHHWVVDGGMLSNFPIWLFDSPGGQPPAWPTFGFLLWEPGSELVRHQTIRGPFTLAKAMVQTALSAHDRKALEEADLRRIVKIPTGRYSTVDFDLTAGDRKWLYDSGYQAAQEFLAGWSWPGYVAQRQQAATEPRRS